MNFYLLTLIKTGLIAFVLLTALAYIQWIERKVLAHIQLRPGPYRVGPHGLLQPLADVIKLITKEGFIPSHVNLFFYVLAPLLAVALALIPIAVIPFGPEIDIFGVRTWMQLTDLKIGALFVLAVSSVGVYGVALAGWASNNKYSLLGGLRSSAQMISYELPYALALAAPLLLLNTLSFREIVNAQAGYYLGFIPRWTIFQAPLPQVLSFIIFLIAGFAETNRIPFDLPEAENELVAGYHVEYASMKFAAFFMAEYRLNQLLFAFPKPVVAFMDGITMGGGVGLALPARYRVATEHTLFAMPEAAIGLFPDVGAGWYLARLPGRLGPYLALTGARLDGGECLWAGLATHYLPSEALAEAKALIADDPAAIRAILDRFSIAAPAPAISRSPTER